MAIKTFHSVIKISKVNDTTVHTFINLLNISPKMVNSWQSRRIDGFIEV